MLATPPAPELECPLRLHRFAKQTALPSTGVSVSKIPTEIGSASDPDRLTHGGPNHYLRYGKRRADAHRS